MKKKLFLLASFAFALTLYVAGAERVYPGIEKGTNRVMVDTAEFSTTFMKPTDGIDWRSDLELSVKYPNEALRQGLEGEVIVLCTVDKNGKVSDVKILKDIGGGAGMEVAEAVRAMKFNPAQQNGYATEYTMAIPVLFELEKK